MLLRCHAGPTWLDVKFRGTHGVLDSRDDHAVAFKKPEVAVTSNGCRSCMQVKPWREGNSEVSRDQ